MRRWVMSYVQGADGMGDAATVDVGQCVTDRHPLLVVADWNGRLRNRDRSVTTALTWYAELTEDDQVELTAAGLDLAAQDVEVRTAGV